MKSAAVIFTIAAVSFASMGNLAAYLVAIVYGVAAIDCWRFK